jgi:simple sugar transport system ATP-binding protein
VLVISEELDELFEICDRIAVIAQGVLSPAVPLARTSPEAIGLLMAGAGAAVGTMAAAASPAVAP